MSFLTDLADQAVKEHQQKLSTGLADNSPYKPQAAKKETTSDLVVRLAQEAIKERVQAMGGNVEYDGTFYPAPEKGPTATGAAAIDAAGGKPLPPEQMTTTTMDLTNPGPDAKQQAIQLEAQMQWKKLHSLKTVQEQDAYMKHIEAQQDRQARMMGVDREKQADDAVKKQIRGHQNQQLAIDQARIGLYEQATRFQNYKNAIPFAGSVNNAVETYDLNKAIGRVASGQSTIDQEKFLKSWLEEQAEIASRGKTMEAQAYDTVVQMVPYAIEWAKTAGIQGTMAVFGKKATLKLFGPLMRVAIEKLPGKLVPLGARGAVALTDLGKATGTAVGMTAGSPGRVAETYQQMRMPKDFTFDDQGKLVITKPGDGPVTAAIRSVGYNLVQNFTEQAGEKTVELMKGAGSVAGKGVATASRKIGLNPDSLVGKLQNSATADVWAGVVKAANLANSKVPAVQTINKALKAMKWDGFVGENMEEFLANYLTALTDTNPQDAGGAKPLIERLKDATMTKEQLGVQAMALAVPGAVGHGIDTAVSIHQSDVLKNKRDKAKAYVLSSEGAQWLWEQDPHYASILASVAGVPSRSQVEPLNLRMNQQERRILAGNLREVRRGFINQNLASRMAAAQAAGELEPQAGTEIGQKIQEKVAELAKENTTQIPASVETTSAQAPINAESASDKETAANDARTHVEMDFQQMPENVLKEYADNGIEGAKVELARRQASKPKTEIAINEDKLKGLAEAGPIKPEELQPGDRVEFYDSKGKKLTGTIKHFSDRSGETWVSIDTDQVAEAGGVPIGRIEHRPISKLTKKLPAKEPQGRADVIEQLSIKHPGVFPLFKGHSEVHVIGGGTAHKVAELMGTKIEHLGKNDITRIPLDRLDEAVAKLTAAGIKVAVVEPDNTISRIETPGTVADKKILTEEKPAAESHKQQSEEKAETEIVAEIPQTEKSKRKSVIDHLSSDKQARVQQLLKELADKSKAKSGIDPSDMGKAFELTALFIEAGARTFSDYAREVIALTGDWFKPYLKAAYNGARDWPGMEKYEAQLTPYEQVKAADVDKILAETTIEESEGSQNERTEQPKSETETTSTRNDERGLDGSRVVSGGERTLDEASPESGSKTDTGTTGRSSDTSSTGSGGSLRGTEKSGLQRGGSDERGGAGVPDTAGQRLQQRQPVNDKAPGTNYQITENDNLGKGGAKTKARQNLDAIGLLKKLTTEQRKATPEEQAILVKYVGWGGIKQIFNPKDKDWASEYGELKELLTPEEYDAAKRSVLNAHYTAASVIQGMWDGIKTMGVNGGAIMEPALGIGHFFGLMPGNVAANSRLYGVELDKLSAQIAAHLYQNADIQNKPFEKTIYPDNFFDLMISNVPFGDITITDTRERDLHKLKAAIHDYYFAKAVKKTRPGGLVVFITSHYSLDKKDSSQRRAWEEMGANFVGAIRLPYTAFKGNAGTEVVTDIIVLQKRAENEAINSSPFKESVKHQVGDYQFNISEYFIAHPQHVLGTHAATGSMYQGNSYNVEPMDGVVLRDRIGEILGGMNINKGALDEIMQRTAEMAARPDYWGQAPEDMRDFALTVKDGAVLQKRGKDLVRLPMSEIGYDKKVARLEAALKIRDAANRLLVLQRDVTATDEEVQAARKVLNEVYDSYVAEYGPISKPYNKSLFGQDPDAPLLLSLEDYDKDTDLATKAEIFAKRTQNPHRVIESASGASEALSVSLAERGQVDLDYMQQLTGMSQEALISELGTQAYENPITKQWELAGLYLAGNVRAKLVLAQDAARRDKRFQRNVDALKAVQPEDVPPGKIGVRLGSPWIAPEYYEMFIRDLIGRSAHLQLNRSEGTWVLTYDKDRFWNTAEIETFGTPDIPAIKLIDKILNYRDIIVSRRVGDDTIKDPIATAAAQAKAESIKKAFLDWVWREPGRTAALVRSYNDTYNNIVFPNFDGSHLNFPGMNIEVQKKFRDYQKNAVWRILTTGNTMLAHVVGAGKTWTMVTAAMEMKRLGLAKKPIIVVPNHLLEQWPKEFLRIYPGAKILAATPDDFSPDRRKTLMHRIMTGDWDAIIVPQTSFEKVPLAPERIEAFFQKQIAELEDEIHSAKRDKGKDNSNYVRELEAAKARLEQKLEDKLAEWKKDDGPFFDNLGIDALFVDEAHDYKNLWFRTKMGRIPGVKNDGSDRAFDMFMKTEYLNSVTGGKNIVFATGTPISNSLGEMYTTQRYLAPGLLAERNIESFDAWATSFGEVVRKAETTPTGEGVRMHSRFAKFTNIPELAQMFRSFADVKLAEDLNLPTPKIIGDKPKVIVGKKSPELHDYVWGLVARAEAVKAGDVEPWQDNMLNITTDGQKAAIDMRLIAPDMPDRPYSKVNKCVRNVFNIWKAYGDEKGTQIIWLDYGVPHENKGKKDDTYRFGLYSDIKQKLISMGIPADEVAFAQSYKNEKRDVLFKAMNQGKIRVLIASTKLMGTGANIQKQLIAAHHLDCPWKPAELEQRDGRILRQGNMWEKHGVYVFRYVSKGSFDAYRWQTVENKANFIHQVMKGEVGVRESEDISEQGLSFAAAKACASGNPKIFKMVELEAEVRQLRNEQSAHADRQFAVNRDLALIPDKRKYAEKYKLKAQEDKQRYENDRDRIKATESGFEIKIGDTIYTDRAEAGKVLTAMLEAQVQSTAAIDLPIQAFGGFTFKFQKDNEDFRASVTSPNELMYFGLELAHDPAGNITRILNWFEKAFDKRIEEFDNQLKSLGAQEQGLLERRGVKWEKESELKQKEAQLQQIQAELQVNQQGPHHRQEKPPYIDEPDDEIDGFNGRGLAAAHPFSPDAGGPARPTGTMTLPIEVQPDVDQAVLGSRELIHLASELMQGKFPTVHKRIRVLKGQAAGVFYPKEPTGEIAFRADIAIGPIIHTARVRRGQEEFAITVIMGDLLESTGLKPSQIEITRERDKKTGKTILRFYKKDPYYGAKIMAHEIGHLIDWLPNNTMARGNILGRIASLRTYLKTMIGATPQSLEELIDESDRKRLRRQAEKIAIASNPTVSKEQLTEAIRKEYQQLLAEEAEARDLITRDEIMEELKNLTMWWNPFNPDQNPSYTKYRFSPVELYAEAMSVLLTNPAALRLKAPKFYDGWFAYLEEKPQVEELYNKINDELKNGTFEDNQAQRALDAFRSADEMLRKEWLSEKFTGSEALLAAKVLLMDTHAAIKGKAARARRRGKLNAARDPEYQIEAATYSGAERELYLDRLRNEVAVSLERNNVDWELFDMYLMHQRNIHDRTMVLNPWGYNYESSKEAIAKMRERLGPIKMAAIERAQKAFWKLRKELVLSKIEESGIFSDDLYQKIADNEHYATFDVIEYLDEKHGSGTGLSVIKVIGTVKPIMGPGTATVMRDLSLMTRSTGTQPSNRLWISYWKTLATRSKMLTRFG